MLFARNASGSDIWITGCHSFSPCRQANGTFLADGGFYRANSASPNLFTNGRFDAEK
jgi:hypothetical protein